MAAPSLRELKARAQRLKPLVSLGRNGMDAPFLVGLEQALDHHGLVKVKLQAFKEQKKEYFRKLADATGSRVVLAVGHTVSLYREPSSGEEKDNELGAENSQQHRQRVDLSISRCG